MTFSIDDLRQAAEKFEVEPAEWWDYHDKHDAERLVIDAADEIERLRGTLAAVVDSVGGRVPVDERSIVRAPGLTLKTYRVESTGEVVVEVEA